MGNSDRNCGAAGESDPSFPFIRICLEHNSFNITDHDILFLIFINNVLSINSEQTYLALKCLSIVVCST